MPGADVRAVAGVLGLVVGAAGGRLVASVALVFTVTSDLLSGETPGVLPGFLGDAVKSPATSTYGGLTLMKLTR